MRLENLKTKMQGRDLNIYQEAEALREFRNLLGVYYEMHEVLEEIMEERERLFAKDDTLRNKVQGILKKIKGRTNYE